MRFFLKMHGGENKSKGPRGNENHMHKLLEIYL